VGTGSPVGERDDIKLIKMHGSINWAYCDSCQDVRQFALLELKKAFEEDRLSYAVIGICKTCGGQRRPLLVPPLAFKFMMFPNLVSLWNSARRAIESANLIIVVGYSFSEADTYITKMVSRSLAVKADQKLIVVDINAKLVPALKDRFSAHIDDFDERRVLQVVSSCDTILPKILQSLLGQQEQHVGVTTDVVATADRGSDSSAHLVAVGEPEIR
jgi:NAD-dependent SIR2 family protein deacetylase